MIMPANVNVRISHHHLQLGLGFCSKNLQTPYSHVNPFYGPIHTHRFQKRRVTFITDLTHRVGSYQQKACAEILKASECLSQQVDVQELPLEGSSSMTGGIVALGKFDALHIGHRELSIQASKVGVPLLLSLVGIAEVFGWDYRAPIVAKCDRKRVLSSWAPYCGEVSPTEFEVEFSRVRNLTPRQFIEKLSMKLGVRGVVAGENYRFGYKASGDSSELVRLCKECNMGAWIINSVMDKNQEAGDIGWFSSNEKGQVSSTRVRYGLSKGDMKYVSELLGRQHRLMLVLKNGEDYTSVKRSLSVPKSCLLNLPPKDGIYMNCSFMVDEKNMMPCEVILDTTHIHLEFNDIGNCLPVSYQDRLLGIEFGISAV